MNIPDIRAMPQTLLELTKKQHREMGCTDEQLKTLRVISDVHESVFRAYQILERVKLLLKAKTPAIIILELIDEMEGKE